MSGRSAGAQTGSRPELCQAGVCVRATKDPHLQVGLLLSDPPGPDRHRAPTRVVQPAAAAAAVFHPELSRLSEFSADRVGAVCSSDKQVRQVGGSLSRCDQARLKRQTAASQQRRHVGNDVPLAYFFSTTGIRFFQLTNILACPLCLSSGSGGAQLRQIMTQMDDVNKVPKKPTWQN